MRIDTGVEMLELSAALPDGPTVIHPVIIWDETDVVMVDASLPGQVPTLREEFRKAGVPFERLNRVLITHHDLDHIGGLREVIALGNSPVCRWR